MRHLNTFSFLLCLPVTALAQSSPTPADWGRTKGKLSLALTVGFLANKATQISTQQAALSAGDTFMGVQPGLLVSYVLNSRLAVETGLEALPVATGYSYYTKTPFERFSHTYNNSYAYAPLRVSYLVAGARHRLQLKVVAGGGLAFTDLTTDNSFPIGPNSSSTSTSTYPDGSTHTVTTTQRATYEASRFGVVEAGLQGTFFFSRHLALDLTARQLWATSKSARDIRLTVTTPSEQISTLLTTPVQGVKVDVGIAYTF